MPKYEGYHFDEAEPVWYRTAKDAFDDTRNGQVRFWLNLTDVDIDNLKDGRVLVVATSEDHVIITLKNKDIRSLEP